MRAVEWVTPHTTDAKALPTLDQLFTRAWQVGADGDVAQYIMAHPTPSQATELPHRRKLAALLDQGEAAPTYAKEVGTAFESEHGLCRLCPEFSDWYGHRVYICKRPTSTGFPAEALA